MENVSFALRINPAPDWYIQILDDGYTQYHECWSSFHNCPTVAVEKSYEFLVSSFSKIEPLFERRTTKSRLFSRKCAMSPTV